MAIAVTLVVPKISRGQDAQFDFIKKMQNEFNSGNNLKLDFKDVVVVSSMILGFIMVILKKNPQRVTFENIRPSFHENLSKMIGSLADKLQKGSVTPEDLPKPKSPPPASAPPNPN